MPKRASIKWLTDKAQASLEGKNTLSAGPFGEFHVRWILVDIAAEEKWISMSRKQKRNIYALIKAGDTFKTSLSDRDRLDQLAVKDGTIFHLYAIEDESFDVPPLACPA